MLNPGDIVVVKFPFADGKGYKPRPAVVVSSANFHKHYAMCHVVMITSAEHKSWPCDISIAPSKHTGLRNACVIRPAKSITLEIDDGHKIGKVPSEALKKARAFITQTMRE